MTDILLIAVGMAMDAFGVSVALGSSYKQEYIRKGIKSSLIFGGFHLIMPAVGWLIGAGFKPVIASIDHWIAFGLLTIIGVRMITGQGMGRKKARQGGFLDPAFILPLAVATSIDALIVGMGVALLEIPLLLACGAIGGAAFVLSFLGVLTGAIWGRRMEKQAGILGGITLILIGVKTLADHWPEV